MVTLESGVVYLTKKEVCEALDISLSALNKLLVTKRIPHVKVNLFTGSKYRVMFEKTSLDAWFLANSTPCNN